MTISTAVHRTSCLESSFSSVRGAEAKCLRSVQFIPLSSRTLPSLTRIDLAEMQGLLVLTVHKFKLVWNQFRTVQFPRHQFVLKVRSVQFGAPRRGQVPPFISFSSVHSVQFTSGPDVDLYENADRLKKIISMPMHSLVHLSLSSFATRVAAMRSCIAMYLLSGVVLIL